MKVKDLIEALQNMPSDAKVMHLWDGAPRTKIEMVWLARNGDVITSDYDMVCYPVDSRPHDVPIEAQDNYWSSGPNPGGENHE